MITCSDAVRELWSYLDGTVTGAEAAALEEHLSVCRRCCGELDFGNELRSLLRSNASDHLPAEVRSRLVTYLDEL